jgi:alpha-galactosidase
MLIDTCASGGRRNDLETLRRSVPLWRSDYLLEPLGVQNCTYGISSWIPLSGTGIKEADPYLFRSCMSPYANCLWDARRTDLNYDVLRKLSNEWKEIAPNFTGDYYPLTSYSLENDTWVAWQFDRPEQGQGMLQVFRRPESIYRSADFPLRGLDPEAKYTVTNLDKPEAKYQATGRELMDRGVTVEIPDRPGAVVITYKVNAK